MRSNVFPNYSHLFIRTLRLATNSGYKGFQGESHITKAKCKGTPGDSQEASVAGSKSRLSTFPVNSDHPHFLSVGFAFLWLCGPGQMGQILDCDYLKALDGKKRMGTYVHFFAAVPSSSVGYQDHGKERAKEGQESSIFAQTWQ